MNRLTLLFALMLSAAWTGETCAASLAKWAAAGDTARIGRQIARGADPNRLDHDRLPLVEAARAGHDPVVRMLLDAGAGIDRMDPEGLCALVAAEQSDREQTARLLVESGANVNASQSDGTTALMLAVQKHWPDLARRLLQRGADPNTTREGKYTALGMSVGEPTLETARVLLDNGADPNLGYLEIVDFTVTENGRRTTDSCYIATIVPMGRDISDSARALLREHGAKDPLVLRLERGSALYDSLFSKPHRLGQYSRTAGTESTYAARHSLELTPADLAERAEEWLRFGLDPRLLRFFEPRE